MNTTIWKAYAMLQDDGQVQNKGTKKEHQVTGIPCDLTIHWGIA